MQKLTHEQLQKNIPDLMNMQENHYLYHNGYVYFSCVKPGARDATGWLSGGEVFKRVKDDGSKVTVFDETHNQSVTTASSSHTYSYEVPKIADDYVILTIWYSRSNDWEDDSQTLYTYRVKADGASGLER